MRYVVMLFSLLLFEPIIVDQQVYNQILQASHQNMRGPEYDYLRALLDTLEQRVIDVKKNVIEPNISGQQEKK